MTPAHLFRGGTKCRVSSLVRRLHMLCLTPLTRFFLLLHGTPDGWNLPCGPSVILAVLGRLDCALSRERKRRRAGVHSSAADFTPREMAAGLVAVLAGVVAIMRRIGVAVSQNQGHGRLAVQTATYCQNTFLGVRPHPSPSRALAGRPQRCSDVRKTTRPRRGDLRSPCFR